MDFVATPEHFADSGLPTGNGVVTVAVGKLSVRFQGLSDNLREAVLSRYAIFLSQTEPLHTVTLHPGAAAYLDPAPDMYIRLEQKSYPEGQILLSTDFAAIRYATDGHGVLKVSAPLDTVLTVRALENYLRWAIADLALQHEGFILHSAGLVRDGDARVFFGPSGAGKSTVAGLSNDCILLSDDLVLLARVKGQWRATTTPFWGALAQEAKDLGDYPLAGLFRLTQAPAHELRPVPLHVAVGMVAACCPFVSDAALRHEKLLPLVESLCQEIGVRELRFRKDRGFWALLQ